MIGAGNRASQVEREVVRMRDGREAVEPDVLAAEEPLEIRLLWQADGQRVQKSIAITMRTPGDDFELATGFLFSEGIIRGREDVVDVSYCQDVDEEQTYNIVTVTLSPGLTFDAGRLERNFYTTSSCGVCGKATLDALSLQGATRLPDGFSVSSAVVRSLPNALRDAQAVFEKTGGLHAAGLFKADGSLISLREDVGRHNALDKLVGQHVLEGKTPIEDAVLTLSGRASFELLQKALMARIPVVVAVGAPSSLAADVAEAFNITLLGFVRRDGFNVYAGRQRLAA
jgi:FdhD protein